MEEVGPFGDLLSIRVELLPLVTDTPHRTSLVLLSS